MPNAPILVLGVAEGVWLSADGESERLDHDAILHRVTRDARPIVCHAPALAQRLGGERFLCHDILELYAFVRPARFCVPTPRGLAAA